MTLEYLTRLHEEYEKFVVDISRIIPVIRVGWEDFGETENIADAITREYREATYLRDVKL
jgi:hypothetical protein